MCRIPESLAQIDLEASQPDLVRLLKEARREQIVADLAATAAAAVVEDTPQWVAYLEACGKAQDARHEVAQFEEAIRAARSGGHV